MPFMRLKIAPLALVLVAAALIGACSDGATSTAEERGDGASGASAGGVTSATELGASGTLFQPPPPATDFSLVDEGGRPVSLDDFRGEVVAIYFGYTRCPDICPLTLGTYKAALERLPDGLGEQVKVVLLSVDPERDTPEVLARYTDLFGEQFVGITGSLDQVDAVIAAWDIHVSRGEPNDIGAYEVTHPADSWIIDREGRLRVKVSHMTGVDALTSDLKTILEEGTP